MVEFTIMFPIALLVVMSLVQMGLMYSAKQILNEATFIAARAGAVGNARKDPITHALTTAMIPFYQNSADTSPATRLLKAQLKTAADLLDPMNVSVEVLNPSAEVFQDFGVQDSSNQVFIPNDNLEYRDYKVRGASTGLTIQDANALKIRVTYAYELKVPLMKLVFGNVMCAVDSGVEAFGRGSTAAQPTDCARFYSRGRIPLVAYATVQMQSPAQPFE